MYISSSISNIVTATDTIDSLVRYCINGLCGRTCPVDVNKLRRFFLFKPDNILVKTLEATTQLDVLNQIIPTRHYNKQLPYIGSHHHKDDAISSFLYSICAHDGTAAVELIIGTKTILTYVYTIGPKSGLSISKVLQNFFRKRDIPINIWSDNSQEEFMWSGHNIIQAYGVGINKYKAHKHNHNPSKHRIQEIKFTTLTVLYRSGAPSWSSILCME